MGNSPVLRAATSGGFDLFSKVNQPRGRAEFLNGILLAIASQFAFDQARCKNANLPDGRQPEGAV
jgi:hypothetical protein